jgi:hypothetical protein
MRSHLPLGNAPAAALAAAADRWAPLFERYRRCAERRWPDDVVTFLFGVGLA